METFHRSSGLVIGCWAMKPLMLLVFLSGAGLLFGQSVHDSAPEPEFSELSQRAQEVSDFRIAQSRCSVRRRVGQRTFSTMGHDYCGGRGNTLTVVRPFGRG